METPSVGNANLIKEKTISTGTAANLTGIPERTIRQYCETGEIPADKLGGRWRIIREQFAATLQENSNLVGEIDK
jgi:excisionase family DNA binding protein